MRTVYAKDSISVVWPDVYTIVSTGISYSWLKKKHCLAAPSERISESAYMSKSYRPEAWFNIPKRTAASGHFGTSYPTEIHMQVEEYTLQRCFSQSILAAALYSFREVVLAVSEHAPISKLSWSIKVDSTCSVSAV